MGCDAQAAPSPPIPLLRCLAAALDADVRLTAGHDLGSVGFENPHGLNPLTTHLLHIAATSFAATGGDYKTWRSRYPHESPICAEVESSGLIADAAPEGSFWMGESQQPWANRHTVAATGLGGGNRSPRSTTTNSPAQTTPASRHFCRPLDCYAALAMST